MSADPYVYPMTPLAYRVLEDANRDAERALAQAETAKEKMAKRIELAESRERDKHAKGKESTPAALDRITELKAKLIELSDAVDTANAEYDASVKLHMDFPRIVDIETRGRRTWFPGRGSTPARVLVVSDAPTTVDVNNKQPYSGNDATLLTTTLTAYGISMDSVYCTYAVRYSVGRKINRTQTLECASALQADINACRPEVIVCLGADALAAVVNAPGYTMTRIRGDVIDHPQMPGIKLLATYAPSAVIYNPDMLPLFQRDIQTLGLYVNGTPRTAPRLDVEVVSNGAAAKFLVDELLESRDSIILAIDMEWEGDNHMEDGSMVRTLQIAYGEGKVAVFRFARPLSGAGPSPDMVFAETSIDTEKPWVDAGVESVLHDVTIAEHNVSDIDNDNDNDVELLPVPERTEVWMQAARLLSDPKVQIVGHNTIADGEWLLAHGIDIRKKVIWDTMLAEHLMRETGPWGLEDLVIMYTDYGRYALDLDLWRVRNPMLCRNGFGLIPDDILLPYCAIDVDATYRIMLAQLAIFPDEFLEPRGVHREYPGLMRTALRTQEIIYELQSTGMTIDTERLDMLIDMYQGARTQLLGVITTATTALGMLDFNPASPKQVQTLLFDKLELPPVKTTGGKDWSDVVGNRGIDSMYGADDDDIDVASTDSTTLEILEHRHPLVSAILQFRRVDTPCKTWLKPKLDDGTPDGGIYAGVWSDGKLHPRFSQLAETGRFRTSKPNCQNWPKRAEGYMAEVFGGHDKVPPGIRTIVVPPPGYVLMEGDYSQAELFVLAALSGDTNMWEALTTPGKDLHDLTTLSAFGFTAYSPEGHPVTDDMLVDYVKQLEAVGGEDSKEFKAFLSSLLYVDTRGNTIGREEFKSGPRTSGKNINFGRNFYIRYAEVKSRN